MSKNLMEDRSLFISSCSRRELSRRKATHSLSRMQVMPALVVLAALLGALVAALGGV